jgi:hypothetical protein
VRIVADELESLWQSKSIFNGQRLTDNEGVRLSDGEKKGTGFRMRFADFLVGPFIERRGRVRTSTAPTDNESLGSPAALTPFIARLIPIIYNYI